MEGRTKIMAVIAAQAAAFYIFPAVSRPLGPLMTVFGMLAVTALLSAALGSFAKGKCKWLYPIFVGILFVPSVFLYYNASALVHTLWYAAVSLAGVAVGSFDKKDG